MTATRNEILKVVENLSNRYPEMRFGQLIVNLANWATHVPDAIWDVEDEALLQAAKAHLERRDDESRERLALQAASSP